MRLISKRDEFPQLIDELGLKRGAEIGVCEGGFSEHLLKNSKLDILYSIDAWSEDTTRTMSAFKNCDVANGNIEKRYERTVERLAPYGARSKIIRDFSVEAAQAFEKESLDFIYLDASHRFTGLFLDMLAWWPVCREGGIFAGHDFFRKYRFETAYVINGWTTETKQKFYLTYDERKKPYPGVEPSWYLQKNTKRTKEEYFKELPEYVKTLKEQANLCLAGSDGRCVVDLPYEFQEKT